MLLRAVPDPGAWFEGWSLESLGTDNPVSLTLDTSYTLTARFRRLPTLRLGAGAFADRDGKLSIELTGDPGANYLFETASDLAGPWSYLTEQGAPWGRIHLSIEISPEGGPRYFRVR